ncbi:MAG TPA: hypothetical protein VKZ79_02940 [Alphaproteobacteria bacterium]|nr:hypothetical protein [Alphaproteobacteria bacterium]
MSADTTAIQKTVALLRAAPEERFLKAIESLDQHGDAIEIIEIKRQVRDRLAEFRPPRKVSLTRVFCLPFEDLLRDSVVEGTTWIPRAAIKVCWRIVEGHIESKHHLDLKRRLEAALHPSRALISEIGHELWPAASRALATVTTAARSKDQAALALFENNPATIAHAEVAAAACQVANLIEDMKELFPIRPLRSLDSVQRDHLLAELQRLSTENKHDLRCLVHIVAHWTQNPADIFQLCGDMDLGPPTPMGRALMGSRDTVVVARAAEQMDVLKTTLAGDAIDIAGCAELVSVAAECLDSADGLIRDSKDVDPGAVTQMRLELRAMVKGQVMTAASQALSSAWEDRNHGHGAVGREAVIAAESAARAMRKCGRVAPRLGMETDIAKQISSSMAAVRHGVDETLAVLGKLNGQTEAAAAAQATVANATRIIEILDGPERAYEFYREKRTLLRAHA